MHFAHEKLELVSTAVYCAGDGLSQSDAAPTPTFGELNGLLRRNEMLTVQIQEPVSPPSADEFEEGPPGYVASPIFLNQVRPIDDPINDVAVLSNLPHRSLRLDNLSKLPVSYRRLANTAVNGSLADLREFIALCTRTPYSRPKLFLPVFFAILDPTTPNELDFIRHALESTIARALLALRALATGRKAFELQEEASVDIWPRAWKWMHFMDTYRDLLPEASTKDIYAQFLQLIMDLSDHPETKELINTTPGVRVVIARAWAIFIGIDNFMGETGFHDVCRYLGHDLNVSNPKNLEEVIEGAGGSMQDLASLIILHIRRVIGGFFLVGVVGILDDADNEGDFKKILLSLGIVKALTSVVCYLVGTTDRLAGATAIINDCLTLMSRIFTSRAAPTCLPDALRTGLLRAICVCTIAHPSLYEHMESLLREVLPPAMIYHSVISCMPAALIEADGSARVPQFTRSELFKDWERLVGLAQERLVVFQDYEAGAYPSTTACNNTECGKIHDKRSMKRCAACRRLYYCSSECQSLHWRQGGHRHICESLQALRLSEPESLSTRERSFMRTLAHHDYTAATINILVEQVQFIHELPGEPYYLLFDYTAGAVKIEVLPINEVDVPPTPSNFQGQWLDHVARAAKSGGRMQVAIMRCVQDSRGRFQMISMHSHSAQLSEGVQRTAKSIPYDANFDAVRPMVLQKVRALASSIAL
ncbi:hypothetical protein C8J57DRAFT_1719926 [Mycena rebaudengoi]|nr:hypothetical protein C8J57DRAFT_1719926 [Mycena rebaudengoi]